MILTHGANSLVRTKFVLLNNCDNVYDNRCKSLIGPDLDWHADQFKLEDSNVFIGNKCVKLYAFVPNPSPVMSLGRIRSTYEVNLPDNVYTLETYLSNFGSSEKNSCGEVLFSNILAFESFNGLYSRMRLQVKHYAGAYNLYNGASLHDTVGDEIYIRTPIAAGTNCHFAAVLDKTESKIYFFVNGVLYAVVSVNTAEYSTTRFSFGREADKVFLGCNFISVRNGDYSNNRESFTVPTKKYTLKDA